jgi:hypothetical protein
LAVATAKQRQANADADAAAEVSAKATAAAQTAAKIASTAHDAMQKASASQPKAEGLIAISSADIAALAHVLDPNDEARTLFCRDRRASLSPPAAAVPVSIPTPPLRTKSATTPAKNSTATHTKNGGKPPAKNATSKNGSATSKNGVAQGAKRRVTTPLPADRPSPQR